jgi:acetyl esterase/lipase
MKQIVRIEKNEPNVRLYTDIVYGHRKYWCGETFKPLYLTLMEPQIPETPRRFPLIVWLCGGGWTEMDRNVWLPEMVWFAKQGYAIAGVDYSTFYRTRFPEQIEDIKLAIRFLKARAGKFNIDAGKIAVMGESAGGYLTALTGLTSKTGAYDTDEYQEHSSEIQAAIPWYPPSQLASMLANLDEMVMPPDLREYPDLTKLASADSPPFLILHGNGDALVPVRQGEMLYEALENAGAKPDMAIIEGAGHGDPAFVQEGTKKIILDFLRRTLG